MAGADHVGELCLPLIPENQNVKQIGNEISKKGKSKNLRQIDIKGDDLGKSFGCVCRLQSPSKITLVPLLIAKGGKKRPFDESAM